MKFKVTGGLGRLCQFPKTVTVEADNIDTANSFAMFEIRNLITDQDFGGDRTKPMLNKFIFTNSTIEVE